MASSTTRPPFELNDLSPAPGVPPSPTDETTTSSLHHENQRSPATPSDHEVGGDEHERQMTSLPPVDTGKDAWLFLAARFVLEALVWGFPFAYCIFQNYYTTHEPFRGQPHITVVGTLAMGVMYLDVPLVMGTLRLFPRQGRWSAIAGLLLMCLSISLSPLSSTVNHLIATQGILYAIGGSICYSPCIVYMDECSLANVAEALGFFLPGIYLPLFAESVLGASSLSSALTIILLDVASVFGCIAMGGFIDSLHVTTCFLVSTVGATLGVFFLWGFATNIAVLHVFCVVYGLFAGSFTSAWPGVMREVAKARAEERSERDEANVDPGSNHFDPSMVFAFLATGRGVGNVLSGPLSDLLVKADPWQGEVLWGYDSGYGSLIVFTGATTLVSGGSFLFRRIGWL